MKKIFDNNDDKQAYEMFLASWFGLGFMPKAPGTWGTLGALPFAYVLILLPLPYTLLAASVITFIIGVYISQRVEDLTDNHDPGWIVIDEVAGMLLCLALIPTNWFFWILGFIAFRIFDIWKPFPIGFVDKKVGGGLGVMLDDMLAGLFAAIAVWGIINVA